MKKTRSKKYNLKRKKRNSFRKKRNSFRKKRRIKKTLKQSGGAKLGERVFDLSSTYLWGKNKRLFWIRDDIMVKLNNGEFSESLSIDDIFKFQLQQLGYKVNQYCPKSLDKCKLYMLFSFLPHEGGNFYPFHPCFVLTGIDCNGDGEKDTKEISTTNWAYQGMQVWGEVNLQFTRTGIAENIINAKNFPTVDLRGTNEAKINEGFICSYRRF